VRTRLLRDRVGEARAEYQLMLPQGTFGGAAPARVRSGSLSCPPGAPSLGIARIFPIMSTIRSPKLSETEAEGADLVKRQDFEELFLGAGTDPAAADDSNMEET